MRRASGVLVPRAVVVARCPTNLLLQRKQQCFFFEVVGGGGPHCGWRLSPGWVPP